MNLYFARRGYYSSGGYTVREYTDQCGTFSGRPRTHANSNAPRPLRRTHADTLRGLQSRRYSNDDSGSHPTPNTHPIQTAIGLLRGPFAGARHLARALTSHSSNGRLQRGWQKIDLAEQTQALQRRCYEQRDGGVAMAGNFGGLWPFFVTTGDSTGRKPTGGRRTETQLRSVLLGGEGGCAIAVTSARSDMFRETGLQRGAETRSDTATTLATSQSCSRRMGGFAPR